MPKYVNSLIVKCFLVSNIQRLYFNETAAVNACAKMLNLDVKNDNHELCCLPYTSSAGEG